MSYEALGLVRGFRSLGLDLFFNRNEGGVMRGRAFRERADGPYKGARSYIGRATYKVLEEISQRRKLPISRLIAIAVDNELDSPNPFFYPFEMPQNAFIENAYIEEAQKIVRLLEHFEQGIGPEALLLLRRETGIPSKEAFMLAFRELLEAKIIVECPVPQKAKFDYPPGYKYIKLKHISAQPLLNKKKRLLQRLQEEIQRDEERLKDKQAKHAEYGVKTDE